MLSTIESIIAWGTRITGRSPEPRPPVAGRPVVHRAGPKPLVLIAIVLSVPVWLAESAAAQRQEPPVDWLIDTEDRLRRTVPDFFEARDGRVVAVETGLEEAYGGKPRPLVFRFTWEKR